VRAAATGAFGAPPDIVLSGINRGPNTRHAVLHSGTVGAALTAATFGVPALAVSIDAGPPSVHWETAAATARIALEWLLAAGEPLVLDANAPNLPLEDVQGFRRTKLAAFGAVQAVVTESGSGYVRLRYDEVEADYEPGTDAAALAEGFASITAIRAVCEDVDGGLPEAFELPIRSRAD
jgi:5'/3'-nucleotidase